MLKFKKRLTLKEFLIKKIVKGQVLPYHKILGKYDNYMYFVDNQASLMINTYNI